MTTRVHRPQSAATRTPPRTSNAPKNPLAPISATRSRQRRVPRRAGTIEGVEGVERDDLAVGLHEVDAGALHRAEVEVVAVEELRDHHPEGVLVSDLIGDCDLRQAAEQAGELLGGVAL